MLGLILNDNVIIHLSDQWHIALTSRRICSSSPMQSIRECNTWTFDENMEEWIDILGLGEITEFIIDSTDHTWETQQRNNVLEAYKEKENKCCKYIRVLSLSLVLKTF